MRATLWAGVLAAVSSALPQQNRDKSYTIKEHDINYNVFDHAATGSQLKFVNNSGICETTPGVNQYSGYVSVGSNSNMWFWFFEARKAASTAPLGLWLSGGPGCSSMLGLFQENGPCTFNNGGSQKPQLNPHSWNSFANMLYVDQPVGSGFSYGVDTDSTVSAAEAVWKFLQAFYTQFPQYKSRDFGIFTESYGGHYGPEFALYFQKQNAAIDAGKLSGQKVNLVALGINNGWIDPVLQYEAYIDYAVNNTYRKLLYSDEVEGYQRDYEVHCEPALRNCTSTSGDDYSCQEGDGACNRAVEAPLEQKDNFDVYDIRADHDSFPPGTYANYITSASVKKAIGATSDYEECSDSVYQDFASSGDSGRSFLNELSQVIKSNITVLVWAGDADWLCNWMGNLKAVDAAGGSDFKSATIQPYTVNGKKVGEYKTLGNLNWLRVYEAGHEVPAYQPEAALAAFISTLSKKPLTPS